MKRIRTKGWAALVLVVTVGGPVESRADTKTETQAVDPVANARSHFARGVKLYEEDDFRAALIEFDRAYQLAPNWAVLYNVGQSYYQLRDYAGALRTFERYVREGGARISAERRTQVDRELEELRGRVAHVTLSVNVADADVALDDVPVGKSPLADVVIIGAGRHRLTATKAGYVSASRAVDIAGGDKSSFQLELTEEAPAPVASPPSSNHAVAGVALGVGVASVAVGSAFGIAAIGNKSTLSRSCDARKGCPSAQQGEIDAFSRNGTLSTVGFGVGIGGLALGAFLFFRERANEHAAASDEARDRPKGARVTPWVGLGSAGFSRTF